MNLILKVNEDKVFAEENTPCILYEGKLELGNLDTLEVHSYLNGKFAVLYYVHKIEHIMIGTDSRAKCFTKLSMGSLSHDLEEDYV